MIIPIMVGAARDDGDMMGWITGDTLERANNESQQVRTPMNSIVNSCEEEVCASTILA